VKSTIVPESATVKSMGRDIGVNPGYILRAFQKSANKETDGRSVDGLMKGAQHDREAAQEARRKALEDLERLQASRPMKPPGKR
jgi:hypothetical protein